MGAGDKQASTAASGAATAHTNSRGRVAGKTTRVGQRYGRLAAPLGGIPRGVEAEIRRLLLRAVNASSQVAINQRKKELVDYFEHLADLLDHPEILIARLEDPRDSLGATFKGRLATHTRKQLIAILNGEQPGRPGHERPDVGQIVRELNATSTMDGLLRHLHKHREQGRYQEILDYVIKYAWNNARLGAALQAVTIGRNATPSQLERLNVELPTLKDEDVEAIIGDISHRVGKSKVAEAVLSQIDPPSLDPVVAGTIAKMFPNPVQAGPWSPPGNQPINLYIGNEAHRAIAAFYRAMHPGETVIANDFPIGSIIAQSAHAKKAQTTGVTGLTLKPDLTNMSSLELYEIKPWINQAGAVSEAAAYVAIFRKAGVPMKLGSSSAPGTTGIVQAPGGYCRFWSPAPGAIIYQKKNGDYTPPVPAPASEKQSQESSGWWSKMERITGLTGAALVIYIIVSEGSRVIPPRNLVPVP